ncbi:hypothetical protein [Ammoniphilus resinae]|uniref:Uncharacterized protein n=1 Tax=Ammoniphilus resinae TaxID=861532 RepID=A0ABS4GN74_9BACL|nr:hypothetical protein [Ammoniphilus resinae]MBP1931718.1 hypothetical protein [Ammoniphilus resinae]
MKLKDWEIYQKTIRQAVPNEQGINLQQHTPPISSKKMDELRKTVDEFENLPEEYVVLATNILKQFLK